MRAQTNDLQERGESVIRPVARAQNRWYNARPPRAETLQLRGFTQGLSTAFTVLEGVEADQQRQAGTLVAQEKIAEAEKASGKNALAAARLVAKGQLDETENPYFRTGYATTVAQHVASRWQATASAEIQRAYAETPLGVTTEAGVPAASPDAAAITQGKLDEFFQAIGEANPGLADDPWFKREFSRQRSRVEANLFDLGFKLGEQRLAEENRQAKSAQLHDYLIRELGNGGGDIEDINRWTKKNIVAGGIKDWKGFYMNSVESAYSSILNSQGAKAARDFLHRAGESQTGKSKLNTDARTSETFAKLARRAEINLDSERSESEKNASLRFREWQRGFFDSPTYQEILRFDSASVAEAHVLDMRDALFAGTVPGVPTEYATEAFETLRQASRQIRNPLSDDRLARVRLALTDGDTQGARAIIDAGGLSPRDLFEAEDAFKRYEATVGKAFDGDVGVQFETRRLFRLADQLGADESRKAIAAVRKHRADLSDLPPDQHQKHIQGEVLPQLADMADALRDRVEVKGNEQTQTLVEVEDLIASGQDAAPKITSLLRENKLTRTQANALRRGNLAVQKQIESTLSPESIGSTANYVTSLILEQADEFTENPLINTEGDKPALSDQGNAIMGAISSRIGELMKEQFQGEAKALQGLEGDPQLIAMRIDMKREELMRNARRNSIRLLAGGATMEDIASAKLLDPADENLGVLHPDVGQSIGEVTEIQKAQAAATATLSDPSGLLDSLVDPIQASTVGFFDATGSPGYIPFRVKFSDTAGPNMSQFAMSYPPHVTDAISESMGGAVMRKNPIIDAVVNHHSRLKNDPDKFVGPAHEKFLNRYIAAPIENTLIGTKGKMQLLKVDYAHPYAAQLEMVRRYAKDVKNAPQWERFARDQARDLTNKILSYSDLTTDQKIQTTIDTHSLIGLDYQGLISRRLESFDHDVFVDQVPAEWGPKIPWRTMPLFLSREDFESARPSDLQRLYKFLGISGAQIKEFNTAQAEALLRIKRAD